MPNFPLKAPFIQDSLLQIEPKTKDQIKMNKKIPNHVRIAMGVLFVIISNVVFALHSNEQDAVAQKIEAL
jgi:hypothetical protein